MTMQESRLMTVEEFEIIVNLSENSEKILEFIAGEIYEVPSRPYNSSLASIILAYIYIYLKEHDLGHLTGKGGGIALENERYHPDVAFTSYEKVPKILPTMIYLELAPELVVELLEPEDEFTIKLSTYLSVGTMVWIVRPEKKIIEVHESGKAAKIFRENDTIKLESLLPNFELKLSEVFQE
jgi:Uma2 family endonuclease